MNNQNGFFTRFRGVFHGVGLAQLNLSASIAFSNDIDNAISTAPHEINPSKVINDLILTNIVEVIDRSGLLPGVPGNVAKDHLAITGEILRSPAKPSSVMQTTDYKFIE